MKHREVEKMPLFLIAALVMAVAVIAGLVVPMGAKGDDYSQIVGKWVRASGGYVLDIQDVQPGGKLEAAYLNPRPINVSKAEVTISEGKINLFVELRDKHYPGNYYTLTYDPESDKLIGVYHHLGIGQNLNVTFSRKQNSSQ
jgi:uncharacterized protein (DUF2147 family)